MSSPAQTHRPPHYGGTDKVIWIKIKENGAREQRVYFESNRGGNQFFGWYELSDANALTWLNLLAESMASSGTKLITWTGDPAKTVEYGHKDKFDMENEVTHPPKKHEKVKTLTR